ncbi:MAG: hypothetical protein V7K38_10215 [Nostoc sp.]
MSIGVYLSRSEWNDSSGSLPEDAQRAVQRSYTNEVRLRRLTKN